MGQQKRRTASRKRPAARRVSRGRKRAGERPKRAPAAEARAAALFDQQIEPLWDRLAEQSRQFVQGFNQEIGAPHFQTEFHAGTLLVRFAPTGAELLMQLDRVQRNLSSWMSSGCADFGSCVVDQPPVGLTIEDEQLRFVYGSGAISEKDLAVKLLTDLAEFALPASAKSR